MNNRLRVFIVQLAWCICFIISNVSVLLSQVGYIENKGQFPGHVDALLQLPEGRVYLEWNKLKYVIEDRTDVAKVHDRKLDALDAVIKGHVVEVEFLGAQKKKDVELISAYDFYYNYFLGESQNWASEVRVFQQMKYHNLYPGISIFFGIAQEKLKYDFVLERGASPDRIKMSYSGADLIQLKNGHLHVTTSCGLFVEQSPYAYQIKDGRKVRVACNFVLDDEVVSFEFPEGFDKNKSLVIDPVVVFSTYSGGISDNWGYTATYDTLGNMFTGGIVFGGNYPYTQGAYQTAMAGGSFDAIITKYNSAGTAMLYSTFLGGAGNEQPHSLVCDDNGQLYILGVTGSSNFPVTGGYDASFNGGSTYSSGVVAFANGTDIFVSKLSSNGASLISSTFVGGSLNDGINAAADLAANYGDAFRGEIYLSANNVWVASCTYSVDFPQVGSVQGVQGGNQDAVVFKLSKNLAQLQWSTYFGGAADDAAYGLAINSDGELYVTGGTKSFNLPMSSGYNTSLIGEVDGFVARFNVNGSAVLNGSYVGTSKYDQSYFVDIDQNDNVFLFGQSKGNYPLSSTSIYSNPGSGQFIQKFPKNLSSSLLSTVVGSGGGIDLVPSAFMVSNCGQIYFSGWGGKVNVDHGGAAGYMENMPISVGAFQSNTDKSDFYVGVLARDAADLVFGTYFGGASTAEHVDGGTSRFDKKGYVYQAVCAGCGGSQNFPTTPGVWSQFNNSNNCNIGAFKFDLRGMQVDHIQYDTFCIPQAAEFTYSSSGGNEFFWDFGDGQISNEEFPMHIYAGEGHYSVSLTISDSTGCNTPENVNFEIEVFTFNPDIVNDTIICPGDTAFLWVSGADSVKWSPEINMSSADSAQIWVAPEDQTIYSVYMINETGCELTLDVKVDLYPLPQVDAGVDIYANFGDKVQLNGVGLGNPVWISEDSLSCINCFKPYILPSATNDYILEVTDVMGCVNYDTVRVFLDAVIYVPNALTPNGDGKNEYFIIKGVDIVEFELFIFNRWGDLIYYTTEMDDYWDGTEKGKKTKTEVYVWKIKYKDNRENEGTLRGHVSVLR